MVKFLSLLFSVVDSAAFVFGSFALFECSFFDSISFSSHGRLVTSDFVGLDDETVARDIHSFLDLNEVTGNEKRTVDGKLFSASDNIDLKLLKEVLKGLLSFCPRLQRSDL